MSLPPTPWAYAQADHCPWRAGSVLKLPEHAAYLLRVTDLGSVQLLHHGQPVATWEESGHIILHAPARQTKSTRNLLRTYLGIPLHGKPWHVGETPFHPGMVVVVAPVRSVAA